MSETAITYQPEANSLPAPIASIQQWAERRRAFNEFVNTQLRENVDFGKVPGTDKATLLKPGAEKILQMYGCAVMLDAVKRDQEPETGYLYIEFMAKAVSIQTGQIVAMGVGACSSWESKYRWRWEWWNDKGLPDMAGGWEKFTKRNNTVSWRRRMENRDLIDQWNTVIKMAKKRALVDLALTISGASEKFTQDVEDQVDTTPAEHQPEQKPAAQATKAAQVAKRSAATPEEPPIEGEYTTGSPAGNGGATPTVKTPGGATLSVERVAFLNAANAAFQTLYETNSDTYSKPWLINHLKKYHDGAHTFAAMTDNGLACFAWYGGELLKLYQADSDKAAKTAALDVLKLEYQNRIAGHALPEDLPQEQAGTALRGEQAQAQEPMGM